MESKLGFFKDGVNKLKGRIILYPQKGNGWRRGNEFEEGNHKLNKLNVMWQLLEMVHMQPLRPERLVSFRLTCLRQAAWVC